MTNLKPLASVKVIKSLQLNEVEPSCSSILPVPVSLALGAPAEGEFDGDAFYLGALTYQDEEEAKRVDMVAAIFSDNEGRRKKVGAVQLLISLADGNTFKPPYVTDSKGGTKLDCIVVDPVEDDSASVLLQFIEPAEDHLIGYPTLFFHTLRGVVDPGVSVHRIPPV